VSDVTLSDKSSTHLLLYKSIQIKKGRGTYDKYIQTAASHPSRLTVIVLPGLCLRIAHPIRCVEWILRRRLGLGSN